MDTCRDASVPGPGHAHRSDPARVCALGDDAGQGRLVACSRRPSEEGRRRRGPQALGKSVLPSFFRAVNLNLLSKIVSKKTIQHLKRVPISRAPRGSGVSQAHAPLPSYLLQKAWEAGVGEAGNRSSRTAPTSWTVLCGSRTLGARGGGDPACSHIAQGPAPPPRGRRSAPETREATQRGLRRRLNRGAVRSLRTPAYSPPSLGEESKKHANRQSPGPPSWRRPHRAGQAGARPPAGPSLGRGGACGRPLSSPARQSPGSPVSGGRGAARDAHRHHGNRGGRAGGRLGPEPGVPMVWAEEEPRRAGRGVLTVPDPLPPALPLTGFLEGPDLTAFPCSITTVSPLLWCAR